MAVELYPFAASVQGAGHLRREREEGNAARGRKFPCQDSSYAAYCAADGVRRTAYHIACVCDGHGGAAYLRSGTGSRLAVEALCGCVARAVDGIAPLLAGREPPEEGGAALDEALRALAAAVAGRWAELVDADLREHPVAEGELALLAEEDAEAAARYRAGDGLRTMYGTTALACVVAGGGWFALQIGDGDVVLHMEEGGFCKPVPGDDRLFLNQTTSLCDADAVGEFRTAHGAGVPDAVLCSSDGVANSFSGDGQLFEFYGRVLWLFRYWDGAEQDGEDEPPPPDVRARFEAARAELERSLPDISARGSGDDVSLAGYVGIDAERVRGHVRGRPLVARGREAQEAGRLTDAARDFKAAGENGYPEGWHLLGVLYAGLYWKGGEARRRDEAVAALGRAAEQGVAEAKEPLAALLYEVACSLRDAGRHAEAFAAFGRAARYGNAGAQYALGLYYGRPQDYPGCGVRQNFVRAVDWTMQAARQGHAEAECKLGRCYRDGRGVQKDAELSREWYAKAAEHGSEEARAYLAGLPAGDEALCRQGRRALAGGQKRHALPALR